MVPNLSKAGYSFIGAKEYFAHDKRGQNHDVVKTSERVAWAATRNLMTDDPEIATSIMVATALDADRLKEAAGVKNTGRKSTAHVQTLSLAWHPGEVVSRDDMEQAADEVIELLELQDRQVVIWAHNDTAHPHIHLMINRVCMNTGRMATLSNAKLKLDQWANGYEKRRGKILTPKREEKARSRAEARQKYTLEERRAYVQARRKETERTRQRPDNPRWPRTRAAEARRALDGLEAAMDQKAASEAALRASAALLAAAKGVQAERTYRFTRRSNAEKLALEAEIQAEDDEDWALIPPFRAAEEPADAHASRVQDHERQVETRIEQSVTAFADALPNRMSSTDGLWAMFADLRAAAVTIGTRLRDYLHGLAVDHLSSLGRAHIAGIRRETSKIRAEAKQNDLQTAALNTERASLEAAKPEPSMTAPRPGPTYGL